MTLLTWVLQQYHIFVPIRGNKLLAVDSELNERESFRCTSVQLLIKPLMKHFHWTSDHIYVLVYFFHWFNSKVGRREFGTGEASDTHTHTLRPRGCNKGKKKGRVDASCSCAETETADLRLHFSSFVPKIRTNVLKWSEVATASLALTNNKQLWLVILCH